MDGLVDRSVIGCYWGVLFDNVGDDVACRFDLVIFRHVVANLPLDRCSFSSRCRSLFDLQMEGEGLR